MVVMKMTHMASLPETCDDCIYYGCKPHPYKGWSDGCELCGQCMDDDQEEDWIYDGNGRPKNCPLLEIKGGEYVPDNNVGEKEKEEETIVKGLFIPGITAEMFRNGCLESIEALMAEGEIYDVDIPVIKRMTEMDTDLYGKENDKPD